MMTKSRSNNTRILAIALSSRGFGFALLEGEEKLVDWGIKTVAGDKNVGSLAKVEEMIAHYSPEVIVLEDAESTGSRRSARIRELSTSIIASAQHHGFAAAQISREQVMRSFFPDGEGTKHAVAEILAARFPDELGSRLPPKRRAWMSEDYRMDIFNAVALALAFLRKKGR